jgi:predicted dinucleotide-binding enzyme
MLFAQRQHIGDALAKRLQEMEATVTQLKRGIQDDEAALAAADAERARAEAAARAAEDSAAFYERHVLGVEQESTARMEGELEAQRERLQGAWAEIEVYRGMARRA